MVEAPEWFLKSRLMQGEVTAYDPENGTVTVVDIDNRADGPICGLELPCPFSLSTYLGFKSAWQRFAPSIGDIALVAYDTRSEPRIVAFVPYQALNRAHGAQAQMRKLARDDRAKKKFPYGDFQALRSGEWDMRSSGGAYIYGSAEGQLLLSGGPTTYLRMEGKDLNEVRSEGGLWVLNSQGSQVRIGDVKRLVPSPTDPTKAIAESDMSLLDPTAFKEFKVHIENPALPLPLWIADYQLGAVRDSVGAPIFATTGGLARRRTVIYTPTSTAAAPVPVFSETVDATGSVSREFLGSTEVTLAPSANLLETYLTSTHNAGAVTVNATAGALALSSSGATTITSGGATTVTAGGTATIAAPAMVMDALNIQAGSTATSPTVRFDMFLTAMETYLGVCAQAFTSLAAQALPIDQPFLAELAVAAGALAAALPGMATVKLKVE